MISTEKYFYRVGMPVHSAEKIEYIKPYCSNDGIPIYYLVCDSDDNIMVAVPHASVVEVEFI